MNEAGLIYSGSKALFDIQPTMLNFLKQNDPAWVNGSPRERIKWLQSLPLGAYVRLQSEVPCAIEMLDADATFTSASSREKRNRIQRLVDDGTLSITADRDLYRHYKLR